ncbi:hypothetical protein ATO12_16325 [Aquimarina atlantica]|uniref:Uncharacterized protein n=1 Tax=Aquimarina atlantica TaxID=1317122 RepID=A0A023BU12_9FLAO|nr:hypothetical protein [Aquimarina atlantica]EZH73502.1 hypothetical protein ATO12_16325 [Aquimarina atlantica]
MDSKESQNKIPDFDKPNWGDKSFDYFKWFKFHHLKTLEKYHNLINKQYKKLPLGKGYKSEDIKLLLNYLDELIKLYDWLPDTSGGKDSMDKLIEYRNEFEELYLNHSVDDASYWLAQEINLKVFTIYNYMNAICEEE